MDDDDGVDYDQGRGDDDTDESLCNGYHDDITQDQESVWCAKIVK